VYRTKLPLYVRKLFGLDIEDSSSFIDIVGHTLEERLDTISRVCIKQTDKMSKEYKVSLAKLYDETRVQQEKEDFSTLHNLQSLRYRFFNALKAITDSLNPMSLRTIGVIPPPDILSAYRDAFQTYIPLIYQVYESLSPSLKIKLNEIIPHKSFLVDGILNTNNKKLLTTADITAAALSVLPAQRWSIIPVDGTSEAEDEDSNLPDVVVLLRNVNSPYLQMNPDNQENTDDMTKLKDYFKKNIVGKEYYNIIPIYEEFVLGIHGYTALYDGKTYKPCIDARIDCEHNGVCRILTEHA
jgi:hypothetical protein